jgi:hypothetical protein
MDGAAGPQPCPTLDEGFGDIRFLIHDRGSNFTASFDAVQRRFQHRLGQLLQQPGQRQALLPGRATISSAARSSTVGSRLLFLVTSSGVAVITAPFPPGHQPGVIGAGNTVRSTVLLLGFNVSEGDCTKKPIRHRS